MKRLEIHTLEKGYAENDDLILHAAFQILTDFMKKERPDKYIDWNAFEDQKKAWKEIKYLYLWWTEIRPKRQDPLDDPKVKMPPFKTRKIPDAPFYEYVPHDPNKYPKYEKARKKSHQLLQKWDAEDQKNLHRLIEIRLHLWT